MCRLGDRMSVDARTRDELRMLASLTIHGGSTRGLLQGDTNTRDVSPSQLSQGSTTAFGNPPASKNPTTQPAVNVASGQDSTHQSISRLVPSSDFSRRAHRSNVLLEILASCCQAVSEEATIQSRACPCEMLKQDFIQHQKVISPPAQKNIEGCILVISFSNVKT